MTNYLAKQKGTDMAVGAIQPNTTTRNNNTSYLKAGVLGVLGGFAAKYAIPVSRQEYDTFVSQNFIKSHKTVTANDIKGMVKAKRSTFDFVVVSALVLMSMALFSNIYNKLADKTK